MTRMQNIRALLRRFREDERGTTLVEMTVAISCFLLILFGMIDYGRLSYHHTTAEKAMHIATRVAVVRPPACTGVPRVNARGSTTLTPLPRFGASCSAASNSCADPGEITCTGDAGNSTASEIWGLVGSGLPPGTTISNLRFRYTFDEDLGFLGGPYVPMVTVELDDANFSFISPLGQLVALSGGTAPAGLGAAISLPAFSVSLPAEDLAQGMDG